MEYLSNADAYISDPVQTPHGMERTLYDEEGNVVFDFPATFTEAQIRVALDMANKFYAKGIERGKYHKILEIRKALELSPDL